MPLRDDLEAARARIVALDRVNDENHRRIEELETRLGEGSTPDRNPTALAARPADLDAAHDLIADLEREAAEQKRRIAQLESALVRRARPRRSLAKLSAKEIRALIEADQNAARQFVRPRHNVGEAEVIDAIERQSGLSRPKRTAGALVWAGPCGGRDVAIIAEPTRAGWWLTGTSRAPLRNLALLGVGGITGVLAAFASPPLGFGLLVLFGAMLGGTALRWWSDIEDARAALQTVFERAEVELEELGERLALPAPKKDDHGGDD